MPKTVGVAVSNATFHFDKLYTYAVMPDQQDTVRLGSMVLVPFGRGSRARMGVVLACDAEPESAKLKFLFDVAPASACLTPELLRLVHFLKERTFCTYYEAVKAVIPYGAQYKPTVAEDGVTPVLQKQLVRHTENAYKLVGTLPPKPRPTAKQLAAVALLAGGERTLSALEEKGISRAVLDNLCAKGVLECSKVNKSIDLYSSIPLKNEPILLTEEQQAAYDALLPGLEDAAPHSALLYGVTGSGKTLVFLKLIEHCLQMGRRALVLVPEISLTPQMILRLKSQFGKRVAVQHSALNHTERLLQWQMIQDGGADIVVGTRSAIFSPLENIGLVIIDEEQEHTYRSESAPRYSAHEVARQRAAENGALLLLASATPSTESYYAAQHGRTQLVRLTKRYGGNPLPKVQIVDMRAELASGNPREISLAMEDAIRHNLEAGKQTILLLNRRGYQTVAQCEDCREVLKCQKCSVPMVYHKSAHKLLCHYCGSQLDPPPARCPACGGKLQYRGFGTQKAEEELAKLFPEARILRMDQDGKIKSTMIIPTGGGAMMSAEKSLEKAVEKAGISKDDIVRIVTTGYGRAYINSGDDSITEITCHAKGAHYLNPNVRTVIDIGGQDIKAISIDENGAVKNFLMNDKCAAGTGRFLEMMARTLGLSLEEMSTMGLEWKENIVISSMCTVFAESEVVSLVAQNKAVSDIIHGLNMSVASKVGALAARLGQDNPGEYMMTGGVAKNKGITNALEEKLGAKLYICDEAQLCGALGAALFAYEKCREA